MAGISGCQNNGLQNNGLQNNGLQNNGLDADAHQRPFPTSACSAVKPNQNVKRTARHDDI
jgi:hypothetical protein